MTSEFALQGDSARQLRNHDLITAVELLRTAVIGPPAARAAAEEALRERYASLQWQLRNQKDTELADEGLQTHLIDDVLLRVALADQPVVTTAAISQTAELEGELIPDCRLGTERTQERDRLQAWRHRDTTFW